MVNPVTKLNDWDLSYMHAGNIQDHVRIRRAGTIPFMAPDLLSDDYWQGDLPRLDRHGLEELIWVPPWSKPKNPIVDDGCNDYNACLSTQGWLPF